MFSCFMGFLVTPSPEIEIVIIYSFRKNQAIKENVQNIYVEFSCVEHF